jgi:hypothetical protein
VDVRQHLAKVSHVEPPATPWAPHEMIGFGLGDAVSVDAVIARHTASAEMKWMNGWSIAAAFEAEFSEVTRSYAGKGVVRYAW